jgi:hypothetical protein
MIIELEDEGRPGGGDLHPRDSPAKAAELETVDTLPR